MADWRVKPVASLRIVTLACGTEAPAASVTRPRMLPLMACVCANAIAAMAVNKPANQKYRDATAETPERKWSLSINNPLN